MALIISDKLLAHDIILARVRAIFVSGLSMTIVHPVSHHHTVRQAVKEVHRLSGMEPHNPPPAGVPGAEATAQQHE